MSNNPSMSLFAADSLRYELESALEFGVFMQVMDYEKNENLNENLIDAGLDPEELDDMDYFERREILENAGKKIDLVVNLTTPREEIIDRFDNDNFSDTELNQLIAAIRSGKIITI